LHRYLSHKEIDKNAYDSCIDSSLTPFVYAYSWYLDSITDCNWALVVKDNYDTVWPLPFKRKYGIINYYNIPDFTQQLGIFSKFLVEDEDIKSMLAVIPFNNVVLRHNFNFNNLPTTPFIERVNFEIELSNYETVSKGYNKDLRRNIQECIVKSSPIIKKEPSEISLTVDLFKQVYHANIIVEEYRYDRLKKAFRIAIDKGFGENFIIESNNGDLLGRAFILRNKKYLHYILAAPTASGRKSNIMHYFIDYIIKNNCSKGLIFDFEGSDMPNVAHFYRKFGPTQKTYFTKNIWVTEQIINKWKH
jgi:hypothetical protein